MNAPEYLFAMYQNGKRTTKWHKNMDDLWIETEEVGGTKPYNGKYQAYKGLKDGGWQIKRFHSYEVMEQHL